MLYTKRYIITLQVFVWLISVSIFFLYLKQRLATYPMDYVAGVTFSSFLSFALIIYGYLFLYNRLFPSVRTFLFVGAVSILFLATAGIRMVLENLVIAPMAGKGSIFDFGKVHLTYTLTSCFFALIIGILLKSFTEVVFLRTRQAETQKKHLEAELRQLKAHVQPHFLFNSLNNLYYDTYKHLPEVAERIAKLSEIMRYFIEESPKDKVQLATEIKFIESFIELEKVRFHTPIDLYFEKAVGESNRIPPMLLIPLVENVFKHGLRNNGASNKIHLVLQQKDQQLYFQTSNALPSLITGTTRQGTGLHNLKERLNLLYGNTYSLTLQTKDGYFFTELILPL